MAQIETFEGLPIVDTGGRSLISALDAKKISFPNDGADFGNSGDQLRSLGNGGVEWAAPGMPTYEQTEQAISEWLNAHPEATTTVADGAITDAKLNDALKRGLVYGFETVADMKAADTLTDGMICHTNGFYASGDGGAAWYKVSATGTANEIDVISLVGGLVANLVILDVVNIKQFGIDSENDNYEKLQYIFTMFKGMGKKLYFPSGRYITSKTLVIGDDTVIEGDGVGTEFYGEGEDFHHFGTVLALMGSNITVKNFSGSYEIPNPIFVVGGNYGLIGISHYTFESCVEYASTMGSTDLLVQDSSVHENISVENLTTDCHYPLQVEGDNCKNIRYSNIFAPNGTVSYARNEGYDDDNWFGENITCAYFRAWDTNILEESDRDSINVNLNNISCNGLFCNIVGANLSNVTIHYEEGNEIERWLNNGNFSLRGLLTAGCCNVSNVVIDCMNNPNKTPSVIVLRKYNGRSVQVSNLRVVNCVQDNEETTDMRTTNADISSAIATNCDLSNVYTTENTPAILSGIFENCTYPEHVSSTSSIHANNWYGRSAVGSIASFVNGGGSSMSGRYENKYYIHKNTIEINDDFFFTPVTVDYDVKIATMKIAPLKTTCMYALLIASDNSVMPALMQIKTNKDLVVAHIGTRNISIKGIMLHGAYAISESL